MRIYIEDGPHQGQTIDIPKVLDRLLLPEPSTHPLRPMTTQRYLRMPYPDKATQTRDFQQGIDARFRWDP